MDINKIENGGGANSIESAKFKNSIRRCLLYKDEVCTAPNLSFEACRACVRINEQVAVKSLFDKIKDLATNLLNLQLKGPGQFPPAS